MAVYALHDHCRETMPAAPSSLTDPAIGQLLTAAHALGSDRERLLPVLAAVPGPQARRRGTAPATAPGDGQVAR
jgi:hypothetical protein